MCIGEATVKCYECDSTTSAGCGDPIKPDHINISTNCSYCTKSSNTYQC